MTHLFYILCTAGLVVFSFGYLYIKNPFLNKLSAKNQFVSYENSKLALDRIEKFTTWLTGLQVAAIASMGFLIKDCQEVSEVIDFGFLAILFFGASIILSTWLISALPSIQQRLKNSKVDSEGNDIYLMNIFSFIPLRMGRFAGLLHSYFLIGIIFFAIFILKSLSKC